MVETRAPAAANLTGSLTPSTHTVSRRCGAVTMADFSAMAESQSHIVSVNFPNGPNPF